MGGWGWCVDVFGSADIVGNDVVRIAGYMFHHETVLLKVCGETLDEGVSTLCGPQKVSVVHVQNEGDLP